MSRSAGNLNAPKRRVRSAARNRLPGQLDSGAQLGALIEQLRTQNETLRLVQQELEQSRDRYARLYDLAPVGYMTLDRNGIIEGINLTAAALLSASRESILGKPLLVYLHKDDRKTFLNHMLRARGMSHAVATEVRICPAGVPYLRSQAGSSGDIVAVQLTTIATPRGRLGGLQYLTVITDLTEQYRLREATARADREKAELVMREQTAKAANEAKDRFLAILSHELRTPLTPILAAVSAASNTAPHMPEPMASMLQMIRRNIQMEARLIDDLLDITRINRDKLSLVFQAVDAHAVLREIVAMLAADIETRRIEIRLDTSAEQHIVVADRGRLGQVFWNVLGNAIKFTPDGGRIDIRTLNRPLDQGIHPIDRAFGVESGAALIVEVQDTGMGISPEALPRLFTPFEQADSAWRQRTGLGLGLAICHGLMQRHGGRIFAQSDGRGKGSRFTIELATINPTAAAAEQIRAVPPEQKPSPRRVPLHILLVEDHPDTARIMAQLLRSEGHEVAVAHTMRSAVELASQQPDVIVSDIGLPDGSGLELMRIISRNHRIPGVALSGFGSEQDVQRSREAGFEEHITKPVDFNRLIEAIQRLTGQISVAV